MIVCQVQKFSYDLNEAGKRMSWPWCCLAPALESGFLGFIHLAKYVFFECQIFPTLG